MSAVLDANMVLCPGENAFLDATGGAWVRNRARAGVFPKPKALELTLSVEWPYGQRYITIGPINVCACCGRHAYETNLCLVDAGPPAQWRCEQHTGRNPCVAEGCGRTAAANRPRLDGYVCGRHWRIVPKPMKLVYSRIWRLRKKSGGWTETLIARHNRVWARIVALVVKRARGGEYVGLAAIEREFGL